MSTSSFIPPVLCPSSRAERLPDAVRVLYPFPGQACRQPAGVQHFLDEGRGHPLLMVHGNPTWSFHFRALVLGLRGSHRCIVPDHLGCGLSDKPQQGFGYTLTEHIDNLERLVDALGLESLDLVLHDWGGAIGMGLAVRRPERIRRILLLNTAAFRAPWIPKRIALLKVPVLGAFLVRGFNAFAGPATVMTTVRPLSAAVRQGYLWPYRSWHDRIATHRFVRDIPLHEAHPTWEPLARIEAGLPHFRKTPVQICWGAQDWCFHDRFLETWRRTWPQAQVHYLESAGHYALEDAPATVVDVARAHFGNL